jgi:hypothetical protein
MRKKLRFLVPLLAGIALAALPMGCGGSSHPAVPSTVHGRVVFQGQPISGGMVVFTPDRSRGAAGKPLRCDTRPDGTFDLLCDGGSAIPPGWYRVAIAPPAGGSSNDSAKGLFPPKLRRPDTSTLVREVTAGKDHVFDFAVDVPAPTN